MLSVMFGPPEAMCVVLIRLWFEGSQFRARVMFESDDADAPQAVAVTSIDEICDVIRRAVDAKRA
jgi:hypothetical protein